MLWLPAPNIVNQLHTHGWLARNDPRYDSPWVSLKGRPQPQAGDRVRVYRNLNNGQYSVVALNGPYKGLVLGYAPAIGIRDVTLRVSDKTRNKVVREGVRTVHAWCEGHYITCSDQPPHAYTASKLRVTYMPFIKAHFFLRTTPDRPLTTLNSTWAYEADLCVAENPND